MLPKYFSLIRKLEKGVASDFELMFEDHNKDFFKYGCVLSGSENRILFTFDDLNNVALCYDGNCTTCSILAIIVINGKVWF